MYICILCDVGCRIIGLCNNFPYVIMLSAAYDIIHKIEGNPDASSNVSGFQMWISICVYVFYICMRIYISTHVILCFYMCKCIYILVCLNVCVCVQFVRTLGSLKCCPKDRQAKFSKYSMHVPNFCVEMT